MVLRRRTERGAATVTNRPDGDRPSPAAGDVDRDRTVEIAWLPLWQAQLVVHELWERDIPVAMAEDHTSHLRLAALQPMARIFAMSGRADAARRVVEELIGGPPVPQHR
jgi:hypothetical protein